MIRTLVDNSLLLNGWFNPVCDQLHNFSTPKPGSMFTRFVFSVVLLGIFQLSFGQDLAILKNGNRLEGEILSRTRQEVVFKIDREATPITIARSEIMLLQYDHRPHFSHSLSFELSMGMPLVDPANTVKELLADEGFDDTRTYVLGLKTKYPVIRRVPSLGLAVNYAVNGRAELGLGYQYKSAYLKGFNATTGNVELNYDNHQLTPVFRHFTRYHNSFLELGFPITSFQLKQVGDNASGDRARDIQAGIKLGGGIVLSQKQLSGLQLRLNYYFNFAPFRIEALQYTSEFYADQTRSLFQDQTVRYHFLEFAMVYSARKWRKR
ncbi:hypothetical protein CRP01_39160 [Flavilitoribacter nigricans DSM 23189 = NBRC 102662]|uniref:Uncharacterized protein n=2 Tax=Flavilitoribacter TaxID=2762562 RepID=A0A2D0MY24_FLAN2|nr:hypothetical protein CRP01_39160 [Flavilitoribacter nigricans DSM 23189 = NBRC 102662]